MAGDWWPFIQNIEDVMKRCRDLEQKIDDGIKTKDASFEIDHNMATFAFYKIVKSQKKYPYAKSILACIEKKDGLTPKINEEKKVLNSLIENKFSK